MVLMFAVVGVRSAHADRIDVQVKQLRRGGQYKLRLSAALKLSKIRDRRAVSAMAYALRKDSQATIRRVAALSLSKMLDESVPVRVRDSAMRALESASKRDSDSKVRKSAAKAYKQLKGLRTAAGAAMYLQIGMPFDRKRVAPKGTTTRMQVAVRRSLRTHAPKFAQRWPSGGSPTQAQLRSAGTKAFFVGASVAGLTVTRVGGRAEIKCSVAVRVNPWSGRDGKEKWLANKAASATGSGKVIGANTRSGIAGAKLDCLLAVVEQITARQVVPFLRRLAK